MGIPAQVITFDYAQLLTDNEIARMIKKVVGGIRVDRATMTVVTRLRSIVNEAEDHYLLSAMIPILFPFQVGISVSMSIQMRSKR